MKITDLRRVQRSWARVAGLMFWVVLVMDMTGMQLSSTVLGRSLMLVGSLCTVLLALGLYYALKPAQPGLAAGGLSFRLFEAALGIIGIVAGFSGIEQQLAGSQFGELLLSLARWDHATNFSALSFTIGSTIFFYVFVTSGYIPKILAAWGLFASVVAFAACATHLLRPAFPAMTMYAWVPMLIAETSTGLWLLIRSVNVPNQNVGYPAETSQASAQAS